MENLAPLYTTQAIKALEQVAIQQGTTEAHLMEAAGEAALDCLRQTFPAARSIAVFCGSGNNGGDGLVLARLWHLLGLPVTVVTVGNWQHASTLAQQMMLYCASTGVPVLTWAQVLEAPLDADVYVDAILGTGLERALSGEILQVVNWLNAATVPILALDVPTGINANTGAVMGMAVRACHTITFLGIKLGLMTGPALNNVGTLSYASLHLAPITFTQVTPTAWALIAAPILPAARVRDCNKGQFGHVAVVGGNHGMYGAPRLAAMAAARVGAGKVTVITQPQNAITLANTMPELLAFGAKQALPTALKPSIWVAGPGIGRDMWAKQLMTKVLAQKTPLLIDADGLHAIARQKKPRDNWILTPHPGEAAMLLGVTSEKIQADRIAAAQALAAHYGGVIVLKGAGTVIMTPRQLPIICANVGNPGMASAGMGDCLSGVIAGWVAQGVSLYDAAILGVWMHAKAADLDVAAQGERGLLASDLLPWLRQLANSTGVSPA